MRLIGDIHGERKVYLRHLQDAAYSLQLGDLDYDYSFLDDVDPARHRFLPGNCDNYDVLPGVKHSLGNYGTWTVPEFGDIFYVRGAWSMDWRARCPADVHQYGKVIRKQDWWVLEELPSQDAFKALEAYKAASPKFVVTHTCPDTVYSQMFRRKSLPTKTGATLETMFQYHQPATWVFSHFHMDFDREIEGTRFICVNAWRYIDL